MPFDPATLAYLALCLAIAGFVKGASGIGLPVVAVPFMALAVDLPLAVALMPVAIVASNFVNALEARHHTRGLRRFWPIFLALPLGTALGTMLLKTADTSLLKTVVGVTVLAFVALQLVKPHWRLSDRAAVLTAPLAGFAAGVIGGITSIFAPPLVMFLLATGLDRNAFVATISVYYIAGTLALAAFLATFRILDLETLAWSAAAFLPVLAGQLAGTVARRRISERVFRGMVLAILLAAGVTMVLDALRPQTATAAPLERGSKAASWMPPNPAPPRPNERRCRVP